MRSPALALLCAGLASGFATARGAEPPPASKPATLSLSDAERNALRNQPALRQAAGQTEAAEGRVEQARAGYLPQLNGTGTYQRTTGNFAQRPGSLPGTVASSGWNGTTYNYYNFGLAASQLIYDFNATADRWRAAGANRDAAHDTQRATEAQTLLGLRRGYFLARAQEDLVSVARATVRNQQLHLDQIQQFVRAGMRPDIDLATARTALANAQVQLVTASNNYQVALAQLNQAMGVPIGARFQLADGAMPPVPGEGDPAGALQDQAVRARPELAAAGQQRRAQELLVSSLRGGYGPALAATAGVTETGSTLDRLVPNWFVGLSLNWAILQGGLTHGQVREAHGTLAALTAQEDAVRLQIGLELEQARLGVLAAKSSIDATTDALTNAREQLRLAEARYATGLGNAVELSDAQVAFSNASAQEVQARYNLSSARAQLIAAKGQP